MSWEIILGLAVGILITSLIIRARIKWIRGKSKRIGRQGEHRVAKFLNALKRKDNILLNDIIISSDNGRTSQIDHILVSKRGIFVIETKSFQGRIVGSEHAQYWTQHLSSQSRNFYNPLRQNKSHIKTLHKLFPEFNSDLFFSIIVFTEAWRLDIKADEIVIPRRFLPDKVISRTFIPSEQRKKHWWKPGKEVVLDEMECVTNLDYLKQQIERKDKILSREEIEEIAERIKDAEMKSRKVQKEHVRYAKDTADKITREIKNGICPRCGSRLFVRKGKNGDFVACENYPDCKFTCSIDMIH